MILDDIVKLRKKQLAKEKSALSFADADRKAREGGYAPIAFKEAISKAGLNIIAEVKKASPSKGVISEDFKPVETALLYEQAGAAAISVLTEEHYFQGANKYLEEIRKEVAIPLLRKDFIFDPYQIVHAKALGANAVLLIAAMLSKDQFGELMSAVKEYKLDALVEAHTEAEVEESLAQGADIVGINNRNLKTFEVSLSVSERLIKQIPDSVVSVVESGIRDADDMAFAKALGANAVLIGEALMRSGDIKATINTLRGGHEA